MSKKKQGGSTTQHVSPAGKRLGMKLQDGQSVKAGMILVRQRGTKIGAGDGVKVGRDHTLFAVKEGKVKYTLKRGKKIAVIV